MSTVSTYSTDMRAGYVIRRHTSPRPVVTLADMIARIRAEVSR